MAFTGDAADHERASSHQVWPHPANYVDERAKPRARSDQQIQIQKKKRLYGTNLTDRVLDDEISVIELGMERILDQFVVSMILTLVRESDPPARTALQIAACDDFARISRRLVSRDVGNLACQVRCPWVRHDPHVRHGPRPQGSILSRRHNTKPDLSVTN